jgi:hypothetical protein
MTKVGERSRRQYAGSYELSLAAISQKKRGRLLTGGRFRPIFRSSDELKYVRNRSHPLPLTLSVAAGSAFV